MSAIPKHHRVILAAAVAAVCGTQARVRQIRAITQRVSSKWAHQGRLNVQSSHNVPAAQNWGRMPKREPKS
jgi:hypothetical protein